MSATKNRERYNRDKLRCPSDLTHEECALVKPLIPPSKRGGRRRSVNVREVVNGLVYAVSTGWQWRYGPKDLPPKSTIFHYFCLWTYHGVIEGIRHGLYIQFRKKFDHEASPAACIINS